MRDWGMIEGLARREHRIGLDWADFVEEGMRADEEVGVFGGMV